MDQGYSQSAPPLTNTLLVPVAAQILRDENAEIVDFQCHPLTAGYDFTSSILRVSGKARCAQETKPWAAVLKIIAPSPENVDPQSPRYWKREALAYQSGYLENLPGEITAPRCCGVYDQGNCVWLWLEEVQDELGSSWPLEHYGVVARQLGHFNGAYLTGRVPLPEGLWVAQDWLRRFADYNKSGVDILYDQPDHPLVRQTYPGLARLQILTLWEERESWFRILDQLPQVFCHQDAFRRNLFARKDQTVAIDWSFCGISPIGAELAPFIGATLGFFEVPVERSFDLDRIVFEGYVQGLREAGWQGKEHDVRLGYTLSLLLRYALASVREGLARIIDPSQHDEVEIRMGRTTEEMTEHTASLAGYFQAISVEAFKLLGLRSAVRFYSHLAAIGLKGKKGKLK